jgi:hypothetical protein
MGLEPTTFCMANGSRNEAKWAATQGPRGVAAPSGPSRRASTLEGIRAVYRRFGHKNAICAQSSFSFQAIADEDLFELLEAREGRKTPVPCCFCNGQFPFRECRLFILETDGDDDYVFTCEPCYEREIRKPLAKRVRAEWSEAELLELGRQAHVKAVCDARDLDARTEAINGLIRWQLRSREPPPSDPRVN